MSNRSRSHSNSQLSLVDGEVQRSTQPSRHSLVQGDMQVPAVDVSMQREGTGAAEA